MNLYKSQSIPVSDRWWTPRRIRVAGVMVIVGALLLYGRIAIGAYLEGQMTVFPWDGVGSLAYYVSEGSLVIAWACIFLGFAALRARMLGKGGRLWNIGILLVMAGTAVASLAFLLVTVAPMVRADALVDPGNALIGIGLVLLGNVGSVMIGIALLRMNALRVIAALFILNTPLGIGAVAIMELLIGQQYWLSVLMMVPYCAAVILIGNYLRTQTDDLMTPVALAQ